MATLPYTGREFLASLDDGREVWIYGERVKNITAHPAFQNTARMLAGERMRAWPGSSLSVCSTAKLDSIAAVPDFADIPFLVDE
jgi:hypothetical protein